MWLEEDPGTRINALRLTRAVTTDTDVVATACPYCLQMLEDAARADSTGESLAVRDIARILAESVLVGDNDVSETVGAEE